MICLYLPKECVWKEEIGLRESWKLDKKSFAEKSVEESRRDWKIAEKKMHKKQVESAKKVLVHALRMLEISCQIVEGKQVEYGVGIKYSKQMNSIFSEDWSSFDSIFTPIYKQLLEKLSQVK